MNKTEEKENRRLIIESIFEFLSDSTGDRKQVKEKRKEIVKFVLERMSFDELDAFFWFIFDSDIKQFGDYQYLDPDRFSQYRDFQRNRENRLNQAYKEHSDRTGQNHTV